MTRLRSAIIKERRSQFTNIICRGDLHFDNLVQQCLTYFGHDIENDRLLDLLDKIRNNIRLYNEMGYVERERFMNGVVKVFMGKIGKVLGSGGGRVGDKRRGLLLRGRRSKGGEELRPNWKWKGVAWEKVWGHALYITVPSLGMVRVKCTQDFRWFRKRSKPWLEVWKRSEVTAGMVWKILGLGFGDEGGEREGSKCWRRRIMAWKQMMDPMRFFEEHGLSGQEFTDEKFCEGHEANCTLTFLEWENGAFKGKKKDRRAILRERGLCVLQKDHVLEKYGVAYDTLPMISASSDAVISRRSTRYGWNREPVEIFSAQCQSPFHFVSEKYWKLRNIMPKTGISSRDYIKTQIEMLCSGPHVKRCRLASYSVSHGTTIFDIRRNDRWLALALGHVRDFYHDFVLTGMPPPTDAFVTSEDYAELVDLTKMGLLESKLVGVVRGSKNEEMLPWPVDDNEEFLSPFLQADPYSSTHRRKENEDRHARSGFNMIPARLRQSIPI